MKQQRTRKPRDIGKRWCIECGRETLFRFSPSRNTWVCELCDYDETIGTGNLKTSEERFIELLDKGEIP